MLGSKNNKNKRKIAENNNDPTDDTKLLSLITNNATFNANVPKKQGKKEQFPNFFSGSIMNSKA